MGLNELALVEVPGGEVHGQLEWTLQRQSSLIPQQTGHSLLNLLNCKY
jgi:hypothetical protein